MILLRAFLLLMLLSAAAAADEASHIGRLRERRRLLRDRDGMEREMVRNNYLRRLKRHHRAKDVAEIKAETKAAEAESSDSDDDDDSSSSSSSISTSSSSGDDDDDDTSSSTSDSVSSSSSSEDGVGAVATEDDGDDDGSSSSVSGSSSSSSEDDAGAGDSEATAAVAITEETPEEEPTIEKITFAAPVVPEEGSSMITLDGSDPNRQWWIVALGGGVLVALIGMMSVRNARKRSRDAISVDTLNLHHPRDPEIELVQQSATELSKQALGRGGPRRNSTPSFGDSKGKEEVPIWSIRHSMTTTNTKAEVEAAKRSMRQSTKSPPASAFNQHKSKF